MKVDVLSGFIVSVQRFPYDVCKVRLNQPLHGELFYAHGFGTLFSDPFAVTRTNNNWNARLVTSLLMRVPSEQAAR